MDFRDSPLCIFEKFGMLEMILLLYRNPEGILRVEYRKKLELHGTTAMRNHNILFDNGLVENTKHPTELRFKLTEKGEKIAEYISKMKEII